MRKNQKGIKMFALAGIIVLLLCAAIVVWVVKSGQQSKWRDFARFSEESFSGVFLSMYDISLYDEEDFVTYCGVPTIKAERTVKTWSELSEYLTEIFLSESVRPTIYLGLDPVLMWEMSDQKDEQWEEDLEQYFIPHITSRQDVCFEILLPAPALKYWVSLEEEQIQEKLAAYERLIDSVSDYANVNMYFMGSEHWLIANPGNYVDLIQTNSEVSKKILCYTFCDHKKIITSDNVSSCFEQLFLQIDQERGMDEFYPDLSDWCVVFFGDSKVTYCIGSYSIPGVVGSLTGAQTYNCGEGGVPATEDPHAILSVNRMVDHFVAQDTDGLSENGNYYRGLTDYMKDDHQGKKHCFVLDFGTNDYFGGHPVENPKDSYDIGTYAGALRTSIRTLQDAYPNAEILLFTPIYTSMFSEGTEKLSENGGVFTDYVDATLRVAEEMEVHCLNTYADSGINADTENVYLGDGCHPNETGALLLGKCVVEEMRGFDVDEK